VREAGCPKPWATASSKVWAQKNDPNSLETGRELEFHRFRMILVWKPYDTRMETGRESEYYTGAHAYACAYVRAAEHLITIRVLGGKCDA
jgi:hypothetical protein